MKADSRENFSRVDASCTAVSGERVNDVGCCNVDKSLHDGIRSHLCFSPSIAFMRLCEMSQARQREEVETAAQQIRKWLQTVVDGGLSVQDWAARAGVAKSTIFRALKPSYEFTTSTRTLDKLAQAIGVDAPNLASNPDARIVPAFLPIRYRVQAGLWYEVDNHPHFEMQDPDGQHFKSSPAVAPSRHYMEFPQWLELVCGDSINLKAQDGAYAHVVDALELGYVPKDGDWVVVERRRAQGGLRERTIKQVSKRGRIYQLVPRSSNPKWQDPVDYLMGANGSDLEIEIVGKVIGFYQPTE